MRADVGAAAAAAGRVIRTPSTPRPRGRSPIARCVSVVDAGGQEALELLAALVEHADRRVARAGELARDLEQPLEHRLGVELGDQRAADVHQPPQAVFIHECPPRACAARLRTRSASQLVAAQAGRPPALAPLGPFGREHAAGQRRRGVERMHGLRVVAHGRLLVGEQQRQLARVVAVVVDPAGTRSCSCAVASSGGRAVASSGAR